MIKQKVLKVVLVVVGLLFTAGIYPVVVDFWHLNQQDYGDDMALSLYFALGIFLLLAVRNPSPIAA
jgi:Na+/H+ antiporter NhaA